MSEPTERELLDRIDWLQQQWHDACEQERLLTAERDALAAQVERVRALIQREHAAPNNEGETFVTTRELLAALAAQPPKETGIPTVDKDERIVNPDE